VRVADFDFALPPERIALRPAVPRDSAKLLVVRPDGLADRIVRDLPALLRPGDVLVFNDTKVIPAALTGHRIGRGGTSPKIEALLHRRADAGRWRAFVKPARRLRPGDRLRFADQFEACVEAKGEAGEVTLAFDLGGEALDAAIAAFGETPLPPYIAARRPPDAQDAHDYQTMFAREEGAIAAPTAGLHFTPQLMKSLQNAGIATEFITLHVGAGTFLPVKSEDTREHRMFPEWGEIDPATASRLKAARAAGGRIVAVGTTALRLLESSGLEPLRGETYVFITPGYRFRAVDLLFTNFHLPRSTLFMLVAAFAGLARMQQAYAHAIAHDYRFYSYGDASLLFPAP
jgi:S-adenosylmethionine:tRNA ribosyltransferase-isomerase